MDSGPPAQSASTSGFLTSHAFALGSLLIANLLTILFFMVNGGSVLQVWWVYWLQSVIIGAVNVVRILKAEFKPGEILVNDQPVPAHHVPWAGGLIKSFLAVFFILHYGGFHFGYLVFLLVFTFSDTFTINGVEHQLALGDVSLLVVLLCGIGFALHHILSFIDEQAAIRHGSVSARASAWRAMGQPYLRVLPMHAIIIIGPIISVKLGNESLLIIFMILKTIFDVRLYQRGFNRRSPTASSVVE